MVLRPNFHPLSTLSYWFSEQGSITSYALGFEQCTNSTGVPMFYWGYHFLEMVFAPITYSFPSADVSWSLQAHDSSFWAMTRKSHSLHRTSWGWMLWGGAQWWGGGGHPSSISRTDYCSVMIVHSAATQLLLLPVVPLVLTTSTHNLDLHSRLLPPSLLDALRRKSCWLAAMRKSSSWLMALGTRSAGYLHMFLQFQFHKVMFPKQVS